MTARVSGHRNDLEPECPISNIQVLYPHDNCIDAFTSNLYSQLIQKVIKHLLINC